MLRSENQGATNMVTVSDSGSLTDPIHPECCSRYMESYKREMNHYFNILAGNYIAFFQLLSSI